MRAGGQAAPADPLLCVSHTHPPASVCSTRVQNLILRNKTIKLIENTGLTLHDLEFGCGSWASLVDQRVKRLPAVQETGVRSLGWEDPLEKEMATHSSILAFSEKFHGLRSLVGYSS